MSTNKAGASKTDIDKNDQIQVQDKSAGNVEKKNEKLNQETVISAQAQTSKKDDPKVGAEVSSKTDKELENKDQKALTKEEARNAFSQKFDLINLFYENSSDRSEKTHIEFLAYAFNLAPGPKKVKPQVVQKQENPAPKPVKTETSEKSEKGESASGDKSSRAKPMLKSQKRVAITSDNNLVELESIMNNDDIMKDDGGDIHKDLLNLGEEPQTDEANRNLEDEAIQKPNQKDIKKKETFVTETNKQKEVLNADLVNSHHEKNFEDENENNLKISPEIQSRISSRESKQDKKVIKNPTNNSKPREPKPVASQKVSNLENRIDSKKNLQIEKKLPPVREQLHQINPPSSKPAAGAKSVKGKEEIEKNLRHYKIQEIKRMKQELEEKLKALDEQLNEIYTSDQEDKFSPKKPKNPMTKSIAEEETLKRKQAAEFVHRLNKEKKLREKSESVKKEFIEKNWQEEIERLKEKGIELDDKTRLEKKQKFLEKMYAKDQTNDLRENLGSRDRKGLPEIDEKTKRTEEFKEDPNDQNNGGQNRKKFLIRQTIKYETDALAAAENRKNYKSPFWKQVKAYDQELKNKDKEQEQEKKLLYDKKKQYGRLVKEVYLPKIEKKSFTRDVMINRNYDNYEKMLKQKNPGQEKYVMKMRDKYNLDQTPRSFEEDEDQFESQPSQKKSGEYKSDDDVDLYSRKKSNKVDENKAIKAKKSIPKESSITSSNDMTSEKPNYQNYLNDIKKERADKGLKPKHNNWEKHLNDERMTPEEKLSNIMEDVNRIDYQAKRKEEKMKISPGKVDEDDVNDLYVESIKAKLALLGGLKSSK